jgi:3-deoxy-manno-octulosonate cytidylyltransferase (CMP-KDO synthetase)
MPDCAIIVPGRLGSQRFPRKLLHPVLGQPLILHTAANLARIAPEIPVYFAVAEEELKAVLEGAGQKAILTDPDLPSGTDRVAVANREVGARRVLNVQADEPVLAASHLVLLQEVMDAGAEVGTLASPFDRVEAFRDPNKVKAVLGENGQALYFSRAPVPWNRDQPESLPPGALWHLGIYAYTAAVLEAFPDLPPARLELIEKLEQLRFLENGRSIGVGVSPVRTLGVDVPADIPELEKRLLRNRTDRPPRGT